MDPSSVTALITGGASGLGAATARAFHARGGRVALLDLQEEQGTTLAVELGERTIFQRTDVTSEASVAAAVERARAELGGVQVLVNCAGIGHAALVVGREGPYPLDQFTRVINVNLIGTFNAIRLAAAAMQANAPTADGERGVIVNTASIAAFDGQIGQAAYTASKGGIVAMTLPIARELARFGIRVLTIAPGTFDTPLLAAAPEELRRSLAAQVPFPSRLGRPDEFAALVVHIVENVVLNAETIRLDGGIRMAPR
jgi:NAD(P)-dependent dehydrogenase (short-subunit alcohol dehydrogenase family)